MSILLQIELRQAIALLIVILLTVAAGVLSVVLGVFRRGSIVGRPRVTREDAARMMGVFAVALVVWWGSQIGYFVVRGVIRDGPPLPEADDLGLLPIDWAILALVPFLLGLMALVVGDILVRPGLPRALGFDLARLLPGFGRAAMALLIVFPLIYWCLLLLEALYERVGYDHPEAHDMLRVMMETDQPLVRGMLIFAAVVMAPLFEEFFFRGHLQTMLVRLFTRDGPRPLPGFPVVVDQNRGEGVVDHAEGTAFPSAPPPVHLPEGEGIISPPPEKSSVWPRWLAVILTSLAFALVHPLWTVPAIFVLSVCIGYVYERTGNLWCAVGLHAMFNLSNTVLYLTGVE